MVSETTSVTLLWLVGFSSLLALCTCCCWGAKAKEVFNFGTGEEEGEGGEGRRSAGDGDGDGAAEPRPAPGLNKADLDSEDGDTPPSSSRQHNVANTAYMSGVRTTHAVVLEDGSGNTGADTATVRNLTGQTQMWWKDLSLSSSYFQRHVLSVSAERIAVLKASASSLPELDQLLDPTEVKQLHRLTADMEIWTAPMTYFTDCYLKIERALTFWSWWRLRALQLLRLVHINLPLLLWLASVASLAAMMYVPILLYKYDNDFDKSATKGRDAVEAAFIFFLLGLFLHIILLRALHYSSKQENAPPVRQVFFWLGVLATVLLLVMLGLVAFLTGVSQDTRSPSNGGGGGGGDDDAVDQGNWFEQMSCDCASQGNNNNTRNADDDAADDDLSYNWKCTGAYLVDADGEFCSVNCNACGDKFYDPYVSYCTFAFVYILLFATPLLAFDWFASKIIPKYAVEVPHYVLMTLNGATEVGFPLQVGLDTQQGVEAANYLAEMRASLQEHLPESKIQLNSSHYVSVTNAASSAVTGVNDMLNFLLDILLNFI